MEERGPSRAPAKSGKQRTRGKRGSKVKRMTVDENATPGGEASQCDYVPSARAGIDDSFTTPGTKADMAKNVQRKDRNVQTAGGAIKGRGEKPRTPGGKSKKKTADATSSGSKQKSSRIGNNSNPMFPPHYVNEMLEKAFRKASLVRGTIRINPKSFEDAFVSSDADLYHDIYVSGILNRNRALNGDQVAVDVFPENQWRILNESVTDHLTSNGLEEIPELMENLVKVDDDDDDEDSSSDEDDGDGDEDILIEKIELLECKEEEEEKTTEYKLEDVKRLPDWRKFVQQTGRVVAILVRNHSRRAVGYLKEQKVVGDSRYAIFSPIDSRVPRMLFAKDVLPESFWSRQKDFANTLFVATIVNWERTKFAMGKLVQRLGDDSDVENFTAAILVQNDVDAKDFPESVTACLPTHLPFVIPEEEIDRRRDFRNECVFTVDPLTARDLDDALSVERVSDDGVYKVGVHIADVSYFVSEDKTALDAEAKSRATSVYLVQRVVPMLPRMLSENLCSLNPGEDRLSFSVEWIITESGEIRSQWFGKSIINSAAKLAYEHAQDMIDDVEQQLPHVRAPWTVEDVAARVKILNGISVNLRRRRIESGALRLDNPKLQFHLDRESGLPQGFQRHERLQSHSLVEEFMLLANVSVAEKIYSHHPELSMLRCHPPPKPNMMDVLVKLLRLYDIALDASSSKSLAASLSSCQPDVDEGKYQLLLNMCSKPMQNARYFCSGWCGGGGGKAFDFHHYALNVPFYTHFTSPIRRYPDIVVHRLLESAIADRPLAPSWDASSVQNIANRCNVKKLNAKKASTESDELFFAAFVRECGPYQVNGIVCRVLDHSFDCLVIDVPLVKRVYLDGLESSGQIKVSQIKGADGGGGGGKNKAIRVEWKKLGEAKTQMLNLFTPVTVSLVSKAKKPLEIQAVLQPPSD